MPRRLLFVLSFIAVWALPGQAQVTRPQTQSPEAIRVAVDHFLAEYAKTLPGEVKYEVGQIGDRLSLPACDNPTAELARNVKPIGRTRLAVNCSDKATWTIFIPVTISVFGNYPVAARSLRQGDVVSDSDIAMRSGDLALLPQTTEFDANAIVGKRLTVGLVNGQPFRKNILKAPLLIQRGQNVTIVYESAAFRATNTGEALSDGGEGDIIAVRTSSGQIIKGAVQTDGTVGVR